jgi:hypothetical protein
MPLVCCAFSSALQPGDQFFGPLLPRGGNNAFRNLDNRVALLRFPRRCGTAGCPRGKVLRATPACTLRILASRPLRPHYKQTLSQGASLRALGGPNSPLTGLPRYDDIVGFSIPIFTPADQIAVEKDLLEPLQTAVQNWPRAGAGFASRPKNASFRIIHSSPTTGAPGSK